MSDPTRNTLAASYSAADAVPVKACANPRAKLLIPLHVQWMPTNRCNLNCSFCSCSRRDRNLEMDLPTAVDVIRQLAELGCEAVTITGGGEPLCHPGLPNMIDEFASCGVKVGLVTNGILLEQLERETIERLTWCRISHSDDREFGDGYREALGRVVQSDTDWAFSYVLSPDPNLPTIRHLVKFATTHYFTHVRIVSDILNPRPEDVEAVKAALAGTDSRVIYQSRDMPEVGHTCRICYIKPVIGPDWSIGPCCGYQYALDPPARDLPPSMKIGDARDLSALYIDQRPAREFGCRRCYYMNYNRLLDAMVGEVMHKEFI